MLTQIEGIHHVTSMARDAQATDRFFTGTLGLRRVKKTVNFDAPDVYHLYYANGTGQPGTVMTYFPFPDIGRGVRGAGEVGTTAFAVPEGALDFWTRRLEEQGVGGLAREDRFGERRLRFDGINGDGFALVEVADDPRAPWDGAGIGGDVAIRGFHSASLTLRDGGATQALLELMGYRRGAGEGGIVRMVREGSNGAGVIDLESRPEAPAARQGAGSVHHIAFAVADDAAHRTVREKLMEEGFQVTPVIDRDYFNAIYFRAPGGVLFEIATNPPGFARDEAMAHLGEALKLPTQHEHLRAALEKTLPEIGA
ncbi:ring-cleaving dioxygenase [Nitratireductor pacificus]|uniref:Glyoxalase/bleomycin resistance protein/dioxygenase n=1 Tax=Nitratireductor pacificus pht-3B TaxID=391937 RepID=K2N3H8_9HYPH|nr:ring-cleaving dioxygenase [Nitratireductor pacificus]EKF18818.1 glyoxalase/bleomycin resistance protein/dioxygenase [Nitratireductor pacificus pht-3B]